MKKEKSAMGVVVVCAFVLLIIFSGIAGGTQGKPFQELWGALWGLQDQIGLLQQKVSELEARVAELEGQLPSDGTSCDDGNACTTDDVYQSGVCIGTPVNCDDGDLCTVDMCDSMTGFCIYYINPDCIDNDGDGYSIIDGDCNDFNADMYPGAIEVCDGLDNDCNGEVDGDMTTCDDGIACTYDYCGGSDGCQYEPKTELCDDGNECTLDSCVPEVGCENIPQEDGTLCIGGTCLDGVCVSP